MPFELYPADYKIYTVAGYTIKDDLQLYSQMYDLVTTNLTVQAWIDQKSDLWHRPGKVSDMTRDELERWMAVVLSFYQTNLPAARERFGDYLFNLLGVAKSVVVGKMIFDPGNPFQLKVKLLPSIAPPGSVYSMETYAAMKPTAGVAVAAELIESNIPITTFLIGSVIALFTVGKVA